MNPAAVLTQIEEEITWRQDELRLLHNQAGTLAAEGDRKSYRKCLVVMLYSHLEGFCKQAFALYVEAINKEKLKRAEVCIPLIASCFEEPFKLLRDQSHKHPYFKSRAPDETQLHQFYREATFVENLDHFFEAEVDIPVDKVVSTESNLTPVVMQKLLYRLGFDPKALAAQATDVGMLLGLRNAIAHGRMRDGVDEMLYEKVRRAAFDVMVGVKTLVFDALVRTAYLKTA